ncbi:CDP-alcohol phosphatidyltransferase family protein [Reinekea marinisedimentorum]|uniref:Phosphatidylglycerophosphate synthase n=1 Tax=Reinekea marinisedimentorum TaxID=230495 RepID=A0A4R3I0L3_9GAMM|nr:CDP-alcohol phosphatidyltransferase family protein [Reinekea marinisedimentorum]TCS38201.1 phosphatidylglycerophosphate synthase [Reinekea marinisedimentorum]
MLDRWSLKLVKPPLQQAAKLAVDNNISANQISWAGFAIGMCAIPMLALEQYGITLLLIALNRIADGLDGTVARMTQSTEQGAYLDIVLDFIFYSGIVFGFALANPEQNALAASALIFSFIGTGSSFLAFAILAEKLKLHSMVYPNKGFYYLNGITEGTETILFFVMMCLFPAYFPVIAWLFFALCVVTTVTRVVGGAHTLAILEKIKQSNTGRHST